VFINIHKIGDSYVACQVNDRVWCVSVVISLPWSCSSDEHKQNLGEIEIVRINSYRPESAKRYEEAKVVLSEWRVVLFILVDRGDNNGARWTCCQ
jgi:hypothetical protein